MSVFVAWMPDDGARAGLVAAQGRLRDRLPADAPRLRWRPAERLHMTLRYLGPRPALAAGPLHALPAALARACGDAAVLDARFDRAEAWPRVLVARTVASPALLALFGAVESAVRGCGFPAQARDTSPHVTLAYADGTRRLRLAAQALPGAPTVAIDQVCLVENDGRDYCMLACWPLRGSDRSTT